MAFDLMSLVAKLTLDSSEYEKGLGDAEKQGGGFGKGVAKAAKGVGVAVAAVTTATAAAGGAFLKGAGDAAAYGDNIDKMSQKMGLSAEKYQEWDAIMQHCGTSIDALKPSMKTLANAAQKNAEEFQALGISQEQVASMSQEELFEATIAGLQNVTDTTERTYLAGKLLGRGATELGALLNTSAEDTEAMRQRVHELGGVMSDEAVKASARYQDSLQDMQTAMEGVKRNILSSFLPAIADAMDGISNLFSGKIEEGQEQIQKGVSEFIQNMTGAIPRFLSVGQAIISAIGEAIIENLPTLLQAGVDAVVQLAQGVSEGLPNLIPSVIEAILTMVSTLLDNSDKLIDAAIALMTGFAQGLINAIPIIIAKVPEIIAKIAVAIITNIPKILAAVLKMTSESIKAIKNIDWASVGVNIVKGIANGIIQKGATIKDSLISMAKNAWRAVIGFFDIGSPSKLMRDTVGKNIGLGMALGIEDSEGEVADAMDSLSRMVSVPDIETSVVGYNDAPMEDTMLEVLNTPDNYRTINTQQEPKEVTVILQLDRTQLARTVFRLNNEERQRVGVSLAGGTA